MDPIPQAIAADTSDDIKELLVFLRKSILDLAYTNRAYLNDKDGNRDNNPIMKQFLSKLVDADGELTTEKINGILGVLAQGTIKWKVKVGANQWNENLLKKTWQDCGEFQIVSCPLKDDELDPFSFTQWNIDKTCNEMKTFDEILKEECSKILKDPTFSPADYWLNYQEYPPSLKDRVIMTMNKQSIFYPSYSRFGKDKKPEDFAWNWELWGNDNLEFEVNNKFKLTSI